jgi:hypothetical protein
VDVGFSEAEGDFGGSEGGDEGRDELFGGVGVDFDDFREVLLFGSGEFQRANWSERTLIRIGSSKGLEGLRVKHNIAKTVHRHSTDDLWGPEHLSSSCRNSRQRLRLASLN